ncbi:hypothetical protein C943_01442 [Mariniradius saccharolyticus AK6]|uniref:Uncharacterized protein n=1 Tax=Mariniradius saccharolyticus AK6 TaxID=1239962 RepID=M7X3W5_9BACT|nr:hypothetical protein C943_01442 [Mariniradius saccharolyticus AK6]
MIYLLHRNPGKKKEASFRIFGSGKDEDGFGFSPKTGKG